MRADGVVHGLDMATSAKKAFLETVDRVLLAAQLAIHLAVHRTHRHHVSGGAEDRAPGQGPPQCGFHSRMAYGVSGGSLAATANMKFRDAAGYALANTSFMPYDGYFGPDVDTMAYLERMLDDPSSGLDNLPP